jgi:hypothetical protein
MKPCAMQRKSAKTRHGRPALPCPARWSHRDARSGGTYLLVLATTLLASVMGMGALLVVRTQVRTEAQMEQISQTRWDVLSAIDLGRRWIASDVNWRANRSTGVWADRWAIGDGTFSLEASDPIDGNIGNRPHDPVILRATANRGNVRQLMETRLNAQPTPLPALRHALHTGGQLSIDSGHTLTAASASTNGSLYNLGAIVGNIEAGSSAATGVVSGSIQIGVPPKAFPASTTPEMYASLGTTICPGDRIENRVLSPNANPWGTPNPDGVYVVRASQDLTICNSRIVGTLVVICPGCTVTISSRVLMETSRADYPALIVVGKLVLSYESGSSKLSEVATGVNFNPSGTPFEGQSDTDAIDEYPSEIRGLVHVTEKVHINAKGLIRGALLCESTASVHSVEVGEDFEIVYTPTLFTSPPQGYTQKVDMVPQSGSWRRVVD